MKIRCNRVISAAFFVVFVLTSVNAKNIRQNPVENNQSTPAKPSARMSSNLPVSHIEASEMSTTVTTTDTTLVTSTFIDTTGTTTIKETVNNTKATTPINGTANNATATSSIEGTATQAVTITNVGTATETQTDENGLLVDKNVIIHPLRKPDVGQCPKGYSLTPNGNCRPKFVDN
ncbi:uncharacterized protein LOC132948225 [Metopolophium dirhodum]|uniref:uncharacterized protein LOC132948225 n=1 Tax=Metopolophium dirhodum TaxID=44670 RepID=UPI00298F76F5|nr:uncharacterized protein LOC132948225 [Metopolophium dirhodum]